MRLPETKPVDFAPLLSALRSRHVGEFDRGCGTTCQDITQATFEALQKPIDFPPIESAIVPGDRVALAVDPNVPAVAQVVMGAIKTVGQTDAEAIDVVLGDEARQETIDAIRDTVGDQANVVVHHSSDRDGLRYLAADAAADPIYLNRYLVDADFVLPIVVGRPADANSHFDLSGVYPAFADSASRYRYQTEPSATDQANHGSFDTTWSLGVHLVLSLLPTTDGTIETVVAGSPDAVRQRLESVAGRVDSFASSPGLVVISLDGDAQQQTWSNAARAIAAAASHVEAGGVVVLWSQIDSSPKAVLVSSGSDQQLSLDLEQSGDGFPIWDNGIAAAATIGRVAAEHRVLIHCRVDRESIESQGLGFIESADELARLSEAFDSCGVIRAAQFAGTTYDLTGRPTAKREL